VPGASQAGAWRTKHSLLMTNYEPKSAPRRAGDRSEEKSLLFEVPWIKWIGTHKDYDKIDVNEVEHER
jgi:hypothetical protein